MDLGLRMQIARLEADARAIQTQTVELPSDSAFAIEMRNQQLAQREEQQRIKNLVLNYELRESEDQESEATLTPLSPNSNIHKQTHLGNEKPSYHHNRNDRPVKEKPGQRVRKLQMSDVVDWYDKPQTPSETPGRTGSHRGKSGSGERKRPDAPSSCGKGRDDRACRQDRNRRP